MTLSRHLRANPASVSSYRLRNLVLAALLALLAVAITLVYVSRARSQQPAAAAPTTRVLVAARDIPIGTSSAQLAGGGWVRRTSVATGDLVPQAVTSLGALKGRVAVQTIDRGEQLTARRFGAATQQGLRASLTGTSRVVELAGDPHQLLAGTLRDGDRVDVVASIQPPGGAQGHLARIVLQNLLVVQAPSGSTGSTLGGSGSTAAVQLELTGKQAEQLFWVERNADWTLILRPAEHATNSGAGAVSAATLLGGGNGR